MLCEETGRPVRVIVNAENGQGIANFKASNELGRSFARKLSESKVDRLAAIIWQQGEADSTRPPEQYKTDFLEIYNHWTDLPQIDRITFISLGEIPGNQDGANQAIINLPALINGKITETKGLTLRSDGVHLDTEGTREAGRRHGRMILQNMSLRR